MGIYLSDGSDWTGISARDSDSPLAVLLSDGSAWNLAGSAQPSYVPLSSQWEPMSSEVYPGITAAASGSALSYTDTVTARWDESGAFNRQGQLWTEAVAGNPALGCKNLTTGLKSRTNSANPYVPCTSAFTIRAVLENGNKCGFVFSIGSGAAAGDYNCHIRKVGSGQPLRRAAATPVAQTTGTTRRYNLTLPETADWEIWLVASQYTIAGNLPSNTYAFVGLEHESTASVSAAPNVPVWLSGGDSHRHPGGAKVSGSLANNTFASFGIIDAIEELTGCVAARIGQPGCGWATVADLDKNGVAVDIDYVSGLDSGDLAGGSSCFGSNVQRAIIEALVAQDGDWIKWMEVNGSYNDGAKANALTFARVAGFASWLASVDPGISLVCTGVEPHNNWPAAITSSSTYTDQNINHQAIKSAMAVADNRTRAPGGTDGFIDPVFPTPWYDGTGDDNTAGSGTQPDYIGADGLHPNYTGCLYLGGKVVEALEGHMIPAARAA